MGSSAVSLGSSPVGSPDDGGDGSLEGELVCSEPVKDIEFTVLCSRLLALSLPGVGAAFSGALVHAASSIIINILDVKFMGLPYLELLVIMVQASVAGGISEECGSVKGLRFVRNLLQ